MLAKLKALEELQKVDVQILELERSGAENPRALAEIETEISAARAAVDVERGRLADIEKQKKTLEDQIAADKERVKKWEARLTEQRSTREYSALAREIDIAKKQNETTAGEIVELAKQAEDARLAVIEREDAFKARVEALIVRAQEVKKAMAELSTARKALEDKRADAARRVDNTMLRRYETIKKRRGTVIAPIVGGACKGCNMNIPPQLYNELRTSQRIDVCPSCGRMIYAVEAFPGEKSAQP